MSTNVLYKWFNYISNFIYKKLEIGYNESVIKKNVVSHLNTVSNISTGCCNIINDQPSGFFYAIDGAKINRINDRTFNGAATINDGNRWSATPGAGGNQDYISQNIPQGPTTSLSQFASLSSGGGIGGIFGTRTSDTISWGTQGSLAIVGVAINDNDTNPCIAESGYFEAQRNPNCGITTGIEIDSVNHGNYVPFAPYTNLFSQSSGQTFGASIAAGGARYNVDASSAALTIMNNGASFGKGIVFNQLSLATGEAISFHQNNYMQWYSGIQRNIGNNVVANAGYNLITFSSTAFVPYVGQIISFSDGFETFPINTCIEKIIDATHVLVNVNALKNSSGLIISGIFSQLTNSIQSTSSSSNQEAIVFTDNGIILGHSVATNGGTNCAAALKVTSVANGTNYVDILGSSGGSPQIVTNGGSLFISSTTGGVDVGNTISDPTIRLNTAHPTVYPNSEIPMGGSAKMCLIFGSSLGFGIYAGQGVPMVWAGQGSLYLRSDGSNDSNRMYVMTESGWTYLKTGI